MIDFDRYCKWLTAKANQFEYDQEVVEQMIEYARFLNDKNLPIIYNQEHLAVLMGKEYPYLLGISNKTKSNYITYKLPKRHGGFRIIMEPYPSLKEVQDWILKYILDPIKDNYVAKNAKAYMPGRSIKDNVRLHCNKELVFNIDLKDFFGSITIKMILSFFISLGYSKPVAVMLANLCTCNGVLPQGASTSPMLSNMIFKPADDFIFSYCKSKKILFSRYADDLTFSGSFNEHELLYDLNQVLYEHGFRINYKKIKTYRKFQRQLVTNVVVNVKPHVRRRIIRSLRQEAYYISKFGILKHLSYIGCKLEPAYYLKRILGKINYALFLNPKDTSMKTAKSQIYTEINRFAEKNNLTLQEIMRNT